MSWVLKIGGSLYRHPRLPDVINHAADFSSAPLIVAGGGVFADQVRAAQRRWQFSDEAAHRMALSGMHQYAMLLAEFSGFPIRARIPAADDKPCLWLPDEKDLSRDLPRNWQVTSDSIAADLARQLFVDHLVLIKSVAVHNLSAAKKVVDEYFFQIAGDIPDVTIVSIEQWLSTDKIEVLKANGFIVKRDQSIALSGDQMV